MGLELSARAQGSGLSPGSKHLGGCRKASFLVRYCVQGTETRTLPGRAKDLLKSCRV